VTRLGCIAAAVVVCVGAPARADMMNNEAIHEHVEQMLAGVDPSTIDASRMRDLRASRLTLDLGLLVPILGSTMLDRKVFGGIRPSAVVFDWVLGGIVPAGLAVTALAADSHDTRTRLAWTAIGLYATTRIAVLVVGNLHISEYNRVLQLRLGATAPVTGDLAPGLLPTLPW
jgi:hypothetical protein